MCAKEFPNFRRFKLYPLLVLCYSLSTLGSNIFLEPEYSTDVHVVDFNTSRRRYQINNDIKKHDGTYIDANLWIFIKELRLYTFNITQPFKKTSNTIFTLENETAGKSTKKKYNLKVISLISFYGDSNVANINFPGTHPGKTFLSLLTLLKVQSTIVDLSKNLWNRQSKCFWGYWSHMSCPKLPSSNEASLYFPHIAKRCENFMRFQPVFISSKSTTEVPYDEWQKQSSGCVL